MNTLSGNALMRVPKDLTMTIKTGAQYHDHSSYDRHKMTGHALDWSNQPRVFKRYEGIDPVLLPGDVLLPKKRLSHVLKQTDVKNEAGEVTIEDLSRILLVANGLTARARNPDGDFYFRSAASAGALFPTEVYVDAGSVRGLKRGLYHFAVHPHGLHPLRTEEAGAYISKIDPAFENESPVMTFFFTAIFFRSAWKYRDRAYRYHLLDTGHVAENLILALKALGLPFRVHYDFDDERTDCFLGLDREKEVTLVVIFVPGSSGTPETGSIDSPSLPGKIRVASRVSGHEKDYPAVREIHRAGARIGTAPPPFEDVIRKPGLSFQPREPIEPPSSWPEVLDFGDAAVQRRSRRNFVRKPLQKSGMMSLLDALCRSDPGRPNGASPWEHAVHTGFLSLDVEGLPRGFYGIEPVQRKYGMIVSGNLGADMTRICLDQTWLMHAGAHFLFLADFDFLDRTCGPRAYRYAMLTAGRLGERLYLAATAMGLGCCGIGAFYDTEAGRLLGLKDGMRLLYLVAVGAVKRM